MLEGRFSCALYNVTDLIHFNWHEVSMKAKDENIFSWELFCYMTMTFLFLSYRPTHKAYNILLDAFAISGMVEQARTVFKSMRRDRCNLQPRIATEIISSYQILRHHIFLVKRSLSRPGVPSFFSIELTCRSCL